MQGSTKLDVLVDNSSTTVTTSTFRKPTNTELYSKWSSFVPRRYKYNLVNCLLDRAYKICSSYESICSEVDNIKVMLGRNGYPAYLFIYLFYHNAQESTGRKQRKDHHSVI